MPESANVHAKSPAPMSAENQNLQTIRQRRLLHAQSETESEGRALQTARQRRLLNARVEENAENKKKQAAWQLHRPHTPLQRK